MTKTVIKKIKIVKKKDNPIKLNANEKKDSTTLQKVSKMMESCSLSDENKIIKLEKDTKWVLWQSYLNT